MSAASQFPDMAPDADPTPLGFDANPAHFAHQHDPLSDDACALVIAQVHAFLHHELLAAQEDLIRAHLDACENCLDNVDVEAAITRLIQRSCPPASAPSTLRVRIMSLRVETFRFEA